MAKKAENSIKSKREKANITICVSKELYEQLENLRINRIGSTQIIDDRSSVYEKILILGMQQHCEQQRKNVLMEKLDITVLESLNLESVDLRKINPEMLKKASTNIL
jgi:hypothetical protein